MLFDYTVVGLIVIIVAVVFGAAIAYSFIKKKKNYDSEGIPKMVDDPKEKEKGKIPEERPGAGSEEKDQ